MNKLTSVKFINRQRGSGKTTSLIHTAYITGYPIIVMSNARKVELEKQAKNIQFNDILIYTIDEWLSLKLYRDNTNILIDEVEDLLKSILNNYLNANVVAATLSLPMEENID